MQQVYTKANLSRMYSALENHWAQISLDVEHVLLPVGRTGPRSAMAAFQNMDAANGPTGGRPK